MADDTLIPGSQGSPSPVQTSVERQAAAARINGTQIDGAGGVGLIGGFDQGLIPTGDADFAKTVRANAAKPAKAKKS